VKGKEDAFPGPVVSNKSKFTDPSPERISETVKMAMLIAMTFENSVFAALLLLYDVTNRKSFNNTRAWLAEIREYAQGDVVILLLGK
jgi:hypothetical protein